MLCTWTPSRTYFVLPLHFFLQSTVKLAEQLNNGLLEVHQLHFIESSNALALLNGAFTCEMTTLHP